MAIPKSSPSATRLISSRQLVPGSLINDMNDAQYSYQKLLAGGATQALAAPVNAANVEIDAASAAGGVYLPVAYPGAEVHILNNSLNTTTVYGNGTDVVQTSGTTFAAAATGITMATLVSIRLFCIKAGFWQRIITA